MGDRRSAVRTGRRSTIRDAELDDLQAIVEIYNASIPSRESTADTEPVTPDSRRGWLRDRDRGHRPIWVLEEAGEVIAWLSLGDFHERPAYHATAEVGVYVDPRRRRRGAAGALLERAVESSAGLGISRLIALLFAHNPASVALFGGLGFERWGLLPGVTELDGVERDVLILGRRV